MVGTGVVPLVVFPWIGMIEGMGVVPVYVLIVLSGPNIAVLEIGGLLVAPVVKHLVVVNGGLWVAPVVVTL